MPTGNPLSGHTQANAAGSVDGLRDGDHILSPSFTNAYEGVHGNYKKMGMPATPIGMTQTLYREHAVN